jgi:hypothetical protein
MWQAGEVPGAAGRRERAIPEEETGILLCPPDLP